MEERWSEGGRGEKERERERGDGGERAVEGVAERERETG